MTLLVQHTTAVPKYMFEKESTLILQGYFFILTNYKFLERFSPA